MNELEKHRFRQLEGERIEAAFLIPKGLLLRLQNGQSVLVCSPSGEPVAVVDPVMVLGDTQR